MQFIRDPVVIIILIRQLEVAGESAFGLFRCSS
jgi:hypothetical protein